MTLNKGEAEILRQRGFSEEHIRFLSNCTPGSAQPPEPDCPWDVDIYTTRCPKHGGTLADCPAPRPPARY